MEEELPADRLERLSVLVTKQKQLEALVIARAAALQTATDDLRRVSEEDIPSLMDEVGLSDLRLSDGTKVQIKDSIHASVAADGKYTPFILDWLSTSGHGDLIKNLLSISFDRGEEQKATEIEKELVKAGLAPSRKRTVNNQSFTALIRELLEAGEEIPLDDLGVTKSRKTILKEG